MNRRVVDQALMMRVEALLNARSSLPRAKIEGRPKLQVALNGATTDLLVYDEIGYFGISAQDVADALTDVRGDLNVRVNSPGGDVFDGVAIYNMLANHDGQVTVTVDGLAASAASFIAMAGDRVVMNRASQMMIHDASGLCIGNAADMADMAEMLGRISDTIASLYADRTGVEAPSWRERMLAETWYSAEEAVAAGLANEVAPPRRRGDDDGAGAPQASFDLTVFQFAGRAKAPAPPVDIATYAPARNGPGEDHTPIDIDAISSALEALKGAHR